MRIAVLLGIDEDGNHELLKAGDPKECKKLAKELTQSNPTKFKTVRLYNNPDAAYRVQRNMVSTSEAPKTRGRPKKV